MKKKEIRILLEKRISLVDENERIVALIRDVMLTWKKPQCFSYPKELEKLINTIRETR